MSGAGKRLDSLVQKYKAGNISESIARSASASIIREMNKKKIKRKERFQYSCAYCRGLLLSARCSLYLLSLAHFW